MALGSSSNSDTTSCRCWRRRWRFRPRGGVYGAARHIHGEVNRRREEFYATIDRTDGSACEVTKFLITAHLLLFHTMNGRLKLLVFAFSRPPCITFLLLS